MANKEKPAPALLLTLNGPGVRSGRIPIPALIKVCEEAQNAVAKQAEALAGRKTMHPGPVAAGIRLECALELVSIGLGSTTLGFDLVNPQTIPPVAGCQPLGHQAIVAVAHAIRSLARREQGADHDLGVVRCLYSVSGIIDESITSLTWEARGGAPSKPVRAKITKAVRETAAARLSSPSFQEMRIDGILDMADFNRKDRRCRIDPAIGASVVCQFGPEFEKNVHEHFRSPVRVTGIAKVLPLSGKVEHLQMHSIESLPSLSPRDGSFARGPSIDELIEARGVKPFARSTAVDWFTSDDEVDAFVSEIYATREGHP